MANRCKVSGKRETVFPHSGASLRVQPPFISVKFPIVLIAVWLHQFQCAGVRRFVTGKSVFGHVQTAINYPFKRWTLHNRKTVKPRADYVRIWQPVWIWQREQLTRGFVV